MPTDLGYATWAANTLFSASPSPQSPIPPAIYHLPYHSPSFGQFDEKSGLGRRVADYEGSDAVVDVTELAGRPTPVKK